MAESVRRADFSFSSGLSSILRFASRCSFFWGGGIPAMRLSRSVAAVVETAPQASSAIGSRSQLNSGLHISILRMTIFAMPRYLSAAALGVLSQSVSLLSSTSGSEGGLLNGSTCWLIGSWCRVRLFLRLHCSRLHRPAQCGGKRDEVLADVMCKHVTRARLKPSILPPTIQKY